MPGVGRGQVVMDGVDQLDAWADGFEDMDRDIVEHVLREWQSASDIMYEFTQEYVHVISGELKASSEGAEVQVKDGTSVEATITYGPFESVRGERLDPYAAYEIQRGGSHDFLRRGYLAAERNFSEALPKAFDALVDTWH